MVISRISTRSEPTMGSPAGVKTRHQIVLEQQEHAELRREMPISPETMMSLVKRYCAIDNTGEDAVSYSDIIQEVLQADRFGPEGVREMSAASLERLCQDLDGNCDGKLNPIETAVAQCYLSCERQDYELDRRDEKATVHGDASNMKVSLDALFAKLQLRSLSFLKMCLERSGKPVIATGNDITRFPAPINDTAGKLHGTDSKTVERHPHFADTGAVAKQRNKGTNPASKRERSETNLQAYTCAL